MVDFLHNLQVILWIVGYLYYFNVNYVDLYTTEIKLMKSVFFKLICFSICIGLSTSCRNEVLEIIGDDSDGDGIINSLDNCPEIANSNQDDSDEDGIGDVCDPTDDTDTDKDGIIDSVDNCPNAVNPNQEDSDENGVGDACEAVDQTDSDGDGVIDSEDNCPNAVNPNQEDSDENGVGDACEPEPNMPKPCQSGMADIYPCNGYDLMSHLTLSELSINDFGGGTIEGNDSWGWTDPTTNKEYALVGLSSHTAFVDVSDPVNPILLGVLPTATVNSIWRDIKVYKNHAFIVSEAPGHGMQVFDLTQLRNVAVAPETFTADTHFTDFGSAHNLFINESSGYAYIVGTNRNGAFSGGALFVNIQNPTAPVSEGGFGAGGYSHDVQVVNYTGPDTVHTGKEILVGSNENEIVIADVSNKANPIILSTIGYSNIGYTHQGWFTDNMTHFIVGDELDEINIGNNTRTLVFDLSDLDNPTYDFDYLGPTLAIDHNGYVNGDHYFLANYRAGVRVLDISQIGSNTITEIGFFDTYPQSDSANFNGVWNVYPFFTSGNIIISDIERGLFIIRKSN